MYSPRRFAASAAAMALLSGCASLAPERGYSETRDLVLAQRDIAPRVDPASLAATGFEVPAEPLDAARSVELAYRQSPRLREQFARLGLGRAAFEDARRLPNPQFGFSRLHGDQGTRITRSIGIGIGDALLLPLRRRLAEAEFERVQQVVADELLRLGTEVEVAWFSAATAMQVAAMRDLVARSADQSATLAQRFFDAGNIDRLALERELAAAAEARIDAARAHSRMLRARASFADLLGLPMDADWELQSGIAAPGTWLLDVDSLSTVASERRLDLSAAKARVATREQALSATRRWRWLGSLDLGFERESEPDGARMRGPTLDLELPIFDQGQGEVARAQAELLRARAASDALALSVRNEIRSRVDRVRIAHEIVERYRLALLPHREAVVARTQERVNFMLSGVFELIQARQSGYDAYQEYLEAVGDYWIAVAELRRACGGRLPESEAGNRPLLGIEAVLPQTVDEASDPNMHHAPARSEGEVPDETSADPHAHHRDSKAEDTGMDHSQHQMRGAEGDENEEARKSGHDEHSHHDHGDRS